MTFWRVRQPSQLDILLRSRRNIFVQLADGCHALISATPRQLVIHIFTGVLHRDPARTIWLDPATLDTQVYDGNGWNLPALHTLLSELFFRRKRRNRQMASFSPLYADATRFLMAQRDRIGLHVLQELANCSNEVGISFPQPRYLAQTTGYAVEGCLDALDRLQDGEFVRIWTAIDPEIRRAQYRYQLSPSVLYIHPDHLAEAWLFWNRPLERVVMKCLSNDHDPESSTNRESKNKPRNKNQHQTNVSNQQRQEASWDGVPTTWADVAKNTNGMEQGAYSSEQRQNQPQRRKAQETPNPGSAAPLPRHFEPFSDPDVEALAGMVKEVAPELQLATIRMLLEQHGDGAALKALEIMERTDNIRDPAAWLRSMMARLQDAQRQIITDGIRFVSGKYADYIQH